MIEIDIKRKAYDGIDILSTIRFTIEAGETVALLGPSGIGKTTLLRIVSGLDGNFEGSVNRPQKMAMVFQEPTLLPWRNVLKNITLVTGVERDVASAVLAQVGLADKENFFPAQLSLGQRRRLALARALSARPDFLIMDEPFASLDQDLVDEMIDLSRDLISNSNVTTLFVTHSEREAERLSDRILRLAGKPATLVS